jgi:hypothetical protein
MTDKCLVRLEKLLKKSSITSAKKDEIINSIKLAKAEKGLSKVDEVNIDAIAKDVSAQIKAQKIIDKRNALESEIKVRQLTEFVLKSFPDNAEEGLTAILVGSNRRVEGARSAVSVQQFAQANQLIAGFNAELRANNLETMFKDGLEGLSEAETQRRVTNAMSELGQQQTEIEKLTGLKPPVTETNPKILKLAEIMEKYSEMIRQKLNDRGANIEKMWGYIVKQSHDPFRVRNAADSLGLKLADIKLDEGIKGTDINYQKNYTAWKNYVMQKLDENRTFANTDDRENFLQEIFNTLVGNKYLVVDGANNVYGARSVNNITKNSKVKRILHFKTANDWFDYNEKFGVGNLKESFFSGLQTAGRNIGMIDGLGAKPKENFEKIRFAVQRRLVDEGKGGQSANISKANQFDKYMKVVDGSIYTVADFGVARYSAIARSIASMAKLGGATISAAADIGIYGSEMRFQGRSFLGGMAEALGSLMRIKNTKQKKDIAQMLGFIVDNTIYDMSARYQVGDNLSKGWTNAQRTFFKYNALAWWTNTLKEGSMLGMANYFAKQKNIKFKDLNPQLKELFTMYNIDSTKWDVIRKIAMEKADDGTEFINIGMLDKISDTDMKKILNVDSLTERQLGVEKERFKSSVSGMLLDRSIYAVIEPDARLKGDMTQGLLAGTAAGETIRFVGQFKAFPLAILNKVLGRELSYFKGPNATKADYGRGAVGIVALMTTSLFMGYLSMTIKDLLKGKKPRDPLKANTILAAFLQGGGLGIYGDVLFKEVRGAGDVAAGLAGPVPLTAFDILAGISYGIRGEGDKAGKAAFRAISTNIPFLNIFYIKSAYDYLLGHQLMETMNPGILKRVEKRMKKDYNQEYLFTKPSSQFKGF